MQFVDAASSTAPRRRGGGGGGGVAAGDFDATDRARALGEAPATAAGQLQLAPLELKTGGAPAKDGVRPAHRAQAAMSAAAEDVARGGSGGGASGFAAVLEPGEDVGAPRQAAAASAGQAAAPQPPGHTARRRELALSAGVQAGDWVALSLRVGGVCAWQAGRGRVVEASADRVELWLLEDVGAAARVALAASGQWPDADADVGVVEARVDRAPVSSSTRLARRNVVQLLDETEPEASAEPTPRGPGSVRSDGALSELRRDGEKLNEEQRLATVTLLCARDFSVLQGMPGTGKTTVLALAIRTAAAMGRRVLLTAFTHSAVDNAVLKAAPFLLRHGHGVLRLAALVATTCLGTGSALLAPAAASSPFDLCIVDEASQLVEPVALGPMLLARSTCLVGDHEQLPPLVVSPAARAAGMDVSLLRRLAEDPRSSQPHPATGLSPLCILRRQYRMNAAVMALLSLVRERLSAVRSMDLSAVEVATVDRYQGRDKDAVVVSLVRANSSGSLGSLLSDVRRVNVMLTRAKRKLVFVGSAATIEAAGPDHPMYRLESAAKRVGTVAPVEPDSMWSPTACERALL
ncbi:hypothetical protein FNF29_08456 [Cafeteria roenbergensis]|uniref:Uncharacterized protein n=2 Tax=Cafeteria roenbergensis TaxID=33653 RepID=A0A5A8BZ55_CAFRO|nr:hypothetical protein FNF29_08456 [Cafeteria roenbergensis]|eukprot:KAA0145627.1 hypothetical protein FNF29_08456 [Cafeteria roenbergensis]